MLKGMELLLGYMLGLLVVRYIVRVDEFFGRAVTSYTLVFLSLIWALLGRMTLRQEDGVIIFKCANDIFPIKVKTSDIVGCRLRNGWKCQYVTISCRNGNEYNLYPDNPKEFVRSIMGEVG